MSAASGFLLHAVILSTLLAVSHSILKWVSLQAGSDYLANLLQHWTLVGLALLLYGAIFFYYIYVLRSVSLAILYPVYTGLSLLLVMVSGYLFFQEQVSPSQLLGAGCIALGIFLISPS